MRNIKRAGILMVAAISTLFIGVSPIGAQDELNCGDPGTSHNMPVGPDDPHGLDGNNNGIGCEDPNDFPAPAPAPAPADDPEPAPDPAAPAEPQVREPDYTG